MGISGVSAKVEINTDDLKFYNPETKSWFLEDEYTLYVGKDSLDCMNKEIKINFNKEI